MRKPRPEGRGLRATFPSQNGVSTGDVDHGSAAGALPLVAVTG